jgi:Domain of unknown function (DUF3597)
MSLFDTIRNAIFGHAAMPAPSSAPAGSPAIAAAPVTAPKLPDIDARTGMLASPPPSSGGAAQPVDVEAALNAMALKNGQKLNWQTSIVDLMKLVGLDPGLQNRKLLAQELGYQGDAADSASMNVWLHRQVMLKLEQNGGRLPPALRS